MSAAPARRAARVQPAERTHTPRRSRTSTRTAADTERRTRAAERRRRERHFRRRRLDLLQDAGLALVVTIVLIGQTAGLGVLALLMVPLAGVLVGSCVAVRARHHRRRPGRRPAGPGGAGTGATAPRSPRARRRGSGARA